MSDDGILVLGGSGATGRLLVAQLLERGERVVALLRDRARLPAAIAGHPRLQTVRGSVLDLDERHLRALVGSCRGLACCLGHRLSVRGLFGPPRRLVANSLARVCRLAAAGERREPFRVVLMNTAGVHEHRGDDPISPVQQLLLALLRWLVPPHRDNELAARGLRDRIGSPHALIEWCALRPDTLHDRFEVTPYDWQPKPQRSALFDPGRTSRINVAHAMSELLCEDARWHSWRGRMPVVYDREEPGLSP